MLRVAQGRIVGTYMSLIWTEKTVRHAKSRVLKNGTYLSK